MSFDSERMHELADKAADAVLACCKLNSLNAPARSVLDEIRRQATMLFIAGRESAFNQVNQALHGKARTLVTQLTPSEQASRFQARKVG